MAAPRGLAAGPSVSSRCLAQTERGEKLELLRSP